MLRKWGVNPADVFFSFDYALYGQKFEKERPELRDSGFADVDAVLTTRELAKMIKMAGINFRELPWENMMSLWVFPQVLV